MLDRIAALLRALFGDPGSTGRSTGGGTASGAARPADPDLAAAWDELNDYLGPAPAVGGNARDRGSARHDPRGGSRPGLPPESLRVDYANLEVPFGADSQAVRRSYKRLVLQYHPDRHAGDPEKLRVATEITKKVNQSFERIRTFQERSAGER